MIQPPADPSTTTRGDKVLEVRDLRISVDGRSGVQYPVDGISFDLFHGESLGLIGESGTGKSLTSLAMLGLLPRGVAVSGGSVRYRGRDLVPLQQEEYAKLRGSELSMILQDPLTALNPMFRIGSQIQEAIRLHTPLRGAAAYRRAVELLRAVRIADAELCMRKYPHQLSGGMRQRVVGAIAIAGGPSVLVADEATTGLDATVQAAYLRLLRGIQRDSGLAILFVTHDLGVVGVLCDRVAVMYAGQIVEVGSTAHLIRGPLHPYTKGLLDSVPSVAGHSTRLEAIPGAPSSLDNRIDGCRFRNRCTVYTALGEPAICRTSPDLVAFASDRQVACHFPLPLPPSETTTPPRAAEPEPAAMNSRED